MKDIQRTVKKIREKFPLEERKRLHRLIVVKLLRILQRHQSDYYLAHNEFPAGQISDGYKFLQFIGHYGEDL